MKESQAYDKFKKIWGGKFYKLHGGRFQASLPDAICLKAGIVYFFEFKQVAGKTLPWAKCDLAQHLTLMQMLGQYAEVYYVVYSNSLDQFYLCRPCHIEEGKTTNLDDACCKVVR